jgi:hypothetical protein
MENNQRRNIQMKRYVILLSLILAACGSPAAQPVVVPQLIASPTAFIDPASYPTAQANVQAPNQSASGIDVRMDSAWVDGKNVNANICYTLPDASDWSVWSATLNYGGTVLQEYGTTLLSIQEPANGLPGQRCDTLTFVVAPDADLSNLSITVDAIGAAPREGEYCSLYMPKIQQAMMERGTGIVLDCPDGVNMQITNFPPEMTQEQAEQMVFSDEFFTIKGPWSFPINLTQ